MSEETSLAEVDGLTWDRIMLDMLKDEPTWKNPETGEWDVEDAKDDPRCKCERCDDSLGIVWTSIWSIATQRCPNWPTLCVHCAIEYLGEAQAMDSIEFWVYTDARGKWMDKMVEAWDKESDQIQSDQMELEMREQDEQT